MVSSTSRQSSANTGETDFAAELIELGLVLGYRFGQELQRDLPPCPNFETIRYRSRISVPDTNRPVVGWAEETETGFEPSTSSSTGSRSLVCVVQTAGDDEGMAAVAWGETAVALGDVRRDRERRG